MDEFKQRAIEVEGSGWGWLVYNRKEKNLEIITTSNHDTPLDVYTTNHTQVVPIMAVDIWEHSYYLDQLTEKNYYIDDIWNLINWKKVQERLN